MYVITYIVFYTTHHIFTSHEVSLYTTHCVSTHHLVYLIEIRSPQWAGCFSVLPSTTQGWERVEEGCRLADSAHDALDWRSGPMQNGCQKELLIIDVLNQIQFGGCRAECLLHPLRLQERVLPAQLLRHRQARAWPFWLSSVKAPERRTCLQARSSFWNSTLAGGVTPGLIYDEAG